MGDAIASTSARPVELEVEKITDMDLPLCFNCPRHTELIKGKDCETQTWRMKERMKTVSVALVLCLNVGVDPPDVVKTQPCSKLECWIDPLSMPPTKAIEQIGAALQIQYERWQPRARYKQSPDPTTEDIKKLCLSLRRNAKEERVLFHYNGHGVPKPTGKGEIWVFNRNYTQYIPLSMYDLQVWMGAPSIYVYDCSNAGIIIEWFKRFALQHEEEFKKSVSMQGTASQQNPLPAPPNYHNCIQLAACSKTQVLPMIPDLPADLFTSCLTTPIKIAVRWFVMQSTAKLVPKVTMDLIEKIPGAVQDRRTMLGELNWIFTAITDTIAWNTLPRDLFQRLFRQDLLVASLFRNYLLAERIMRSCDCTPETSPPLPSTYQHPMWNAWDLTLDLSLGQLPGILKNNEPFVHLPFFEEQLTAFQVWLDLGSEARNPPEQLPIVLQVLLSQVHRMRALELLGRFLDLGPWAVNLALSVGIFPYVLKLLQSSARELRPLLVFIWAKILAVDNTCQADLVRDGGHKYFLSILQDPAISSDHRTQAAFVLACIVKDYRDGQEAALQGSLVSICLEQLNDPSPQLRQWVAICLGRLWDHYEKARWTGVRDIAHEKLYSLLHDHCPEVRAAAVYALGTFINSVAERSDHANTIDHSVVMTLVNCVCEDMSCLVRKELVQALQWVILSFERAFVNAASQEQLGTSPSHDMIKFFPALRRVCSRTGQAMAQQQASTSDATDAGDTLRRSGSGLGLGSLGHSGSLGTLPGLAYGSFYMKIWTALCSLETDPHPEVAQMCTTVTAYVRSRIKENTDARLSSLSLPPSPVMSTMLSGESPPTLHPAGDYRPRRNRRLNTSIITEDTEDRDFIARTPLIATDFVPWACSKFAEPVMKRDPLEDVESPAYYERDWRYFRNRKVRREGTLECKRILTGKIETQVFSTKCGSLPSVLQFHPFDQQIAIAGNESFFILDWGTAAKMTHCQFKSTRATPGKVTSLEWINGHDLALVMTGFDDGSIKIYRPHIGSSREPTLVSAWQGFSQLLPPTRTNQNTATNAVLLNWEQWTQTIIAAGDARAIRFWNAERELLAFDIPTGSESSVTCLDSSYAGCSYENWWKYTPKYAKPTDSGLVMGDEDEMNRPKYHGPKLGLVTVGCGDGSVRVFDRRCSPHESRVKTWTEHTATVLGVQLRGNQVISGSTFGDVRVFDIRRNESVLVTQALPQNQMSSFAIHKGADIYACGSVNQTISVHNLADRVISTIRYYEGFMGYRIGPVNTLTFHPHRVLLAAGTSDCSVSLYTLDKSR